MEGWKFIPADMEHVRLLWNDLAQDVRDEFAKQGISTLGEFSSDVSSGDRAMVLLYNGEVAAMMWSGYIGDGCRMRSIGCVVSDSFSSRHRFEVGRSAKALLDEYMADEPDRNHGVFVAIPTTSDRLNKFASRLAGMKITGMDYMLGVPHFIYRWEAGNA